MDQLKRHVNDPGYTVSRARFDAVRPGIALYGVSPSEHLRDAALSPALTLETRVLAVKRVPAGTALGYGGTFVTARTTTVATLLATPVPMLIAPATRERRARRFASATSAT